MKPLFSIFMAFYLFFVSSGISISHIYCSKGDRWVIGNEMPPIPGGKCSRHCEGRVKKEFQKDPRQKDTFTFDFSIQGILGEGQEHGEIVGFPSSLCEHFLFIGDIEFIQHVEIDEFLKFDPPPEISEAILEEICVFKI